MNDLNKGNRHPARRACANVHAQDEQSRNMQWVKTPTGKGNSAQKKTSATSPPPKVMIKKKRRVVLPPADQI